VSITSKEEFGVRFPDGKTVPGFQAAESAGRYIRGYYVASPPEMVGELRIVSRTSVTITEDWS
jgi:hypothetical protein